MHVFHLKIAYVTRLHMQSRETNATGPNGLLRPVRVEKMPRALGSGCGQQMLRSRVAEKSLRFTERQLSHVFTHRWFLNIKQRKPAYKPQSQRTQTTLRTLRETYIDLSTWEEESRKRQDLLSKLGAWGPWGRIEGGRQEGEMRKMQSSININKIK